MCSAVCCNGRHGRINMKIKLWIQLAVVLIAGVLGAPSALAAETGKTRVFVEFKPGQKAPVKAALGAAGGQIHYEFDRLSAIAVTLPEGAIRGMQNNPNVVLVEADPPRYPLGETTPYGVTMVQAPDVWSTTKGGGVTIGLIDSGVSGGHEDFKPGNLSGDTTDGCGHGTHVAGTIFAQYNNGKGVVGVAHGAHIHSVKVFGNDCGWTYASGLISAVQVAIDQGAKIISMSLGGTLKSRTEDRAFRDFYSQDGVLSIAAAGNNGSGQNSYPASYSSVISVAAVDSASVVADFSQQNGQVELAAPGVAVRSTVPMGTGKEESLSLTLTVDGSTLDFEATALEGSPNKTGNGSLFRCNAVDGLGSPGDCAGASGNICLIERGSITFAEKVQECQAQGGTGAVIYNNAPALFAGTLGGVNTSIPSVGVSGVDGQTLLGKLGESSTVTTDVGNYAYYDGTSMATPHVSAAAALVWSCNPNWTNAEIRDALQQSALDLGAPGRDNAYGYGLVQAAAALTYLGGSCSPSSPPPTVTITSPKNNATFGSGASIQFAGTATNASGNDVSGSLVWKANGTQIGSGASFSMSLADGTYTIEASASDNNGSGSDSIVITVGTSPPPPPSGELTVVIIPPSAVYRHRDTVYLFVFVFDSDGSAVPGAAAHLDLYAPKTLLTANGPTDADGGVLFYHVVNSKRDGTGTYTATVTATKDGASGSGTVTFEVQ